MSSSKIPFPYRHPSCFSQEAQAENLATGQFARDTKKHPGYDPSYPRCAYNYPDYNYYSAYPYRCTQDPFSYEISCIRRNFVGPDYRDVYYTGKNTIDPEYLDK